MIVSKNIDFQHTTIIIKVSLFASIKEFRLYSVVIIKIIIISIILININMCEKEALTSIT